MIGTVEEAKAIYEWYDSKKLDDDFSYYRAPVGWTYIGNGSSRVAFVGPSGAVYKVQRYADDLYNVQEFANFNRIRNNLPEGWRVPESTLHSFESMVTSPDGYTGNVVKRAAVISIIALEWVDGAEIEYGGEHRPLRASMYEGLEAVGLCDGARGNVLVVEGGFCIVDAGEGWLNHEDEKAYYDEGVQFAQLVAA